MPRPWHMKSSFRPSFVGCSGDGRQRIAEWEQARLELGDDLPGTSVRDLGAIVSPAQSWTPQDGASGGIGGRAGVVDLQCSTTASNSTTVESGRVG